PGAAGAGAPCTGCSRGGGGERNMRGGYLHNRIIAARLLAACHRASVQALEHPTGEGGFVDLYIEHGPLRVVCEIELSPDRIDRDLRKAIALDATHLLIVVPTPRVAARVMRRLERSGGAGQAEVFVLTLGRATA